MYSAAEVAFLLKMTFWPLWPQMTPESRLTFAPIVYLEGLKRINMDESYGHAAV